MACLNEAWCRARDRWVGAGVQAVRGRCARRVSVWVELDCLPPPYSCYSACFQLQPAGPHAVVPAATACCYCLHSVLACCSSSLVLPATACPVCGAAVLHTSAACCYCLLLPTALQCVEPLFLEPSTGRKYPLTASPYEGIEYLWNHQNFWVCMQMALPHSDSRAHPKDVSYDLLDPSKWESVFEGKGAQVRLALSRE